MKFSLLIVVLAVLTVSYNGVNSLRLTPRMSSVLERPPAKSYGVSKKAYWKSASDATPVSPSRSYGIGKSYWKGMTEPEVLENGMKDATPASTTRTQVVAPPTTVSDISATTRTGIAPRSYSVSQQYWKEGVDVAVSSTSTIPRTLSPAPSIETPSQAVVAVTAAPRSYGLSKKYWKSEKIVPDAVIEPKEPPKAKARQVPVTPAPSGVKPPRSYSISKKYWATGTPATSSTPATAPRSYGISKQYWKTQSVTDSLAADTPELTKNLEVPPDTENASDNDASDSDALPRRSYGISKPYWKKSSAIDAKETLNILMSSRSSNAQKESAFAPLRKLRQENIQEYELVVDEMLTLLESIKGNFWVKRRLPFALPSFRTKLGSLKRTLELTTVDDTRNGRKRGLLIALSALVTTSGGVRTLEKQALKGKKEVNMEEMLQRTPESLETPSYTVIDEVQGSIASRAWEVRQYDEFSVCTIETDLDTDGKSSKLNRKGPQGFNTLAGYIFGKNKSSTKMSMTTPVLTTQDKMSFVMPSDFWDAARLSQAPLPIDSSIVLEQPWQSSQTLAVMWFSGYALSATAEAKKDELLGLIESSEEWKLADGAERPFLMQYNDPFVVPWKRRNEVAIPVVPK